MRITPIFIALVITATATATAVPCVAWAGGSIHNHLLLDLAPFAQSPNNPGGGAVGLSYDRIHDELKSSYTLTAEASKSYHSGTRTDVSVEGAFFTEITRAFSLGARLGLVVNNPDSPLGFGSLGLRLPALSPEDKQFFGFYFEEIDLGLSGSGERYAAFRLAMLLL